MKICSATSTGKVRTVNEDSLFVSDVSVPGAVLAVVADGMGGHNAGEVASAEVVNVLKNCDFSEDADAKKSLLDAIEYANNTIYKMSVHSPDLHGMGTTATACVIAGDKVTTAQVGDSRLYLIREQKITQITKDHSLVEMLLERGSITKEDARNHPQKNVITRAIGTDNTVQTDIYEFSAKPEDVLLLCSDGLVNMVEDEKILSLITNTENFNDLAGILVDEAENAGGLDNISVILIKF